MSLTLPVTNFSTWKKGSAQYFYPQNCGDNDHIHVRGSIRSEKITVETVSIKINGRNTPMKAVSNGTESKFDPSTATFPADPLGNEYKQALQKAGLI